MWRLQYNIFDALLFQISFAVKGLACVILYFDIAYDAILYCYTGTYHKHVYLLFEQLLYVC